MSKNLKIFALVLIVSAMLFLASSLSVRAQTTATVAVLSSVGGTTSPAGGTPISATVGQNSTFTASPGSGWQFFYWIVTTAAGSNTYTTNPLSWNVTGAASVQAMFLPTINATEVSTGPGTLSIYVELSAGGATSPAASTTNNYTIGSTQTFTATPGAGFKFVCWVASTLNGGAIVYTANPLNYNVTNSGCGIQALFIPQSSTVMLPTIVPEYNGVAIVALALAMVAVAFGTFLYKRTKK